MNNFKLSPHFTFYELTKTNNKDLLDQNRQLGHMFLPTLKALAKLLETIRNDRPLTVNSAYRCPSLNNSTTGSSKTSQHMDGQAADVCRPSENFDDVFDEILTTLKEKETPFGQLIKEQYKRDYGVSQWIHISLGPDFWNPKKCGEVLENRNGVWKLKEKVRIVF